MCEENERAPETQSAEILHTGSVIARKDGVTIQCLTVIGQVEGHYLLGGGQKVTKYEHLIPLLVDLEESEEIGGLLLILNTMGGDVEAGLALAEMIASMKKPSVSLVLGGGHSIGVPLAVCTNESFIVPTATMTVHPVRISGTVVGAPQTYSYLRRMQDRISRFITSHSNIKEEILQKLLLQTDELATDVGSILDGKEAVEVGLIDRVGGLSDAIAALRARIGGGQA